MMTMPEQQIERLPLSNSYTVGQAIAAAAGEASSLESVMILGHDLDGDLCVISSRLTRAEALWLIKEAEEHCLGRRRDPGDTERAG
jgi:hypothetical protein